MEEVLLGHYIRLGPKNQGSRVYLGAKWLWRGKWINKTFRIKSLLSQNWGACVYTKFWEEKRGNSKLPRLCQSRNRLRKDRISRFRYESGIGSLGVTSADSDDELRLATENYIQDSTKKRRVKVQVILNQECFLLYQKNCNESCSSRIHVQTLAINTKPRLL